MNLRGVLLCTGNSAWSQMAESWLRHLAGDRDDVCSAVTQPVGLNSGPVEAMAESGRWTENMVRLLEIHRSYIGSHRFVDLRHFKDGIE